MERRYQVRLQELLGDAEVRSEQLHGMLTRLEQFVDPFANCLVRGKQRTLTRRYVAGLVSQVKRKNVESIAYHHDQDRQMLQKFVGQYTWDHRPLMDELVRQVGTQLRRSDAVLVFDPSAFPKKGNESVGVQRQWCGRLGKIDNCQVGVYLAYVSADEHALWPRGFLRRKPGWKKKSTPAITVPQVRTILASLLHRKLNCNHPDFICRHTTRRLQRNETARFYHWKQRKRLAPRRINQRR
jgi:SRSO17 transposase